MIKRTAAHLLTWVNIIRRIGVRLLFDVFMVFNTRELGESKEDRHTGMSSVADISHHIAEHGSTGCDPYACEYNITDSLLKSRLCSTTSVLDMLLILSVSKQPLICPVGQYSEYKTN